MKKFRTWYDTSIEEVEIIRESAKFVTESDGRRWAKRSDDFRNYFDTWAEAKAFLVHREQSNISGLKQQLANHEEMLKRIEEMVG